MSGDLMAKGCLLFAAGVILFSVCVYFLAS